MPNCKITADCESYFGCAGAEPADCVAAAALPGVQCGRVRGADCAVGADGARDELLHPQPATRGFLRLPGRRVHLRGRRVPRLWRPPLPHAAQVRSKLHQGFTWRLQQHFFLYASDSHWLLPNDCLSWDACCRKLSSWWSFVFSNACFTYAREGQRACKCSRDGRLPF